MIGIPHIAAIGLSLQLMAGAASAERFHYVVGGRGGTPWSELAHQAVALDDTSFPGALQPKELRPWENAMVGPEIRTSILGLQWYQGKTGGEAFGLEVGRNPRFWESTGRAPAPEVIDGDSTTSLALRLLVPRNQVFQFSTALGDISSVPVFPLEAEALTFDLGISLPLNRVVFFPLQHGIDRRGVPNKEGAPQAFAVSVGRTPHDFLLLGPESLPLNTLEVLVERTLANSRSIVDLSFPLQPVRFLRLDLSLLPQTYALAEFQAFGQGVPPQVTFTSAAIDLGERVNLGRVDYAFRKWRRGEDGELAEDAQGAAALILETRSGVDTTPLAYLVYDDFGGTREVSRTEYEGASLPRRESTDIRYPGQRGPVTEDRQNWSPWSSPYAQPGQQNRSPDGRRYLQFQLGIETADVLSIGRLDSISFEFSPLLVASVVGEISLAGEAIGAGSEEAQPLEVAAGERRVFACDIRAAFDAAAQPGFDGVRLDVPEGTRLLRLEMGEDLQPVEPDSVREGRRQIEVFFPSQRITRADNRPLRLVLEGAVLNSSTFFTGDLFDTQSDDLPQSIESGNARDAAGTNSLQVLAAQRQLSFLRGVEVAPAAFTPNGDGINERAGIRFFVLFVEDAQVAVDILDLAGRRVRRLAGGTRGAGHYAEWWDGRDEGGQLVPPGLYLCRIEVDTQSETARFHKAVSVAY